MLLQHCIARPPRSKSSARALALDLASQVRQVQSVPVDAAIDLDSCSARARADVAFAHLGSAAGGREALLVPAPRGRFRIVLDEAFAGGDPTTTHRRRFRLAHELAHTFFYERSDPVATPRRL